MTPIRRHFFVAIAMLWAISARAQGPCGDWEPVPMPSAAGHGLASVSASSANDAWAVWKAVYHWNGSAWSPVTTPGLVSPDPLGYADTLLSAVAAVTPNHAWIVGNASFLGTPQTLVERWDGTTWSVVPSPVIAGGSGFDAVAARDENDAWAVGYRAGGLPQFAATSVTLTAHWDGSSWSAVPSPNVSNRSHRLEDVTMIATDDVWAVGYSRNLTELYKTLILHWDGSSWSITPSPNFPNAENFLYGVSGTSTDDVWAVGDAWDGVAWKQIFLHWDGSAWSQVDGPGGPTACVGCSGDVLAMGPDDVWAVGSSIGHWNGTQWTVVPDPAVPGAIGFGLRSLARIGDCDAWAVGSSFTMEDESALSVRLRGDDVEGKTVSAGGGMDAGALALRVSPNPSRGESVIELALPSAQVVRVTVLDPSGRRVRDLHSASLPAGAHAFKWDGRDDQGRVTAAGVYFVTVEAGGRRTTARALRLK
jgi:hypothetical protein